MAANQNPRVINLLSWHGHAGGGVHVPFQQGKNPLGATIETPLIRRLRGLARDLAGGGTGGPRWIFLVGGPGNGKSETVQDFLAHLDDELGLGGKLSALLAQRFTQGPVVPRKVDVASGDLPGEAAFGARIGALTVVQDATATEQALGNAAKELAEDIASLLSGPAETQSIFLVCANRGLLARSLSEAARERGADHAVTKTIKAIVQASSLGRETLGGRPDCWPLAFDPRFACWPLDVESLTVDEATEPALATIIKQAVDAQEWDVVGRCADCDSRVACPFFQNARWLQADEARNNLVRILRHGELARGQRWNFRDAFSLVAELVVGQWDDFGTSEHPCAWVHQSLDASTRKPLTSLLNVKLVNRLYGNALFGSARAAAGFASDDADAANQPATEGLFRAIEGAKGAETTKSIRDLLASEYSRLDPASFTPADLGHVLRHVEEAFCQSIGQGGAEAAQVGPLAAVELALLERFDAAEGEWDTLGRYSTKARARIGALRKLAAMFIKRSLGARLGAHALEDFLGDYSDTLRDPQRLARVKEALMPLLGDANVFAFNLVEVLGQPTGEEAPMVGLRASVPGVVMRQAPRGGERAPGHDVPSVEITGVEYRIPLTFDFFMALQLRKAGCAGSSLPSSVRAALDRVRHRHAGALCRDEKQIVDGRVSVSVGDGKKISIADAGERPVLVEGQ